MNAPEDQPTERVVVVGGGPAGLAAAAMLKAAGMTPLVRVLPAFDLSAHR